MDPTDVPRGALFEAMPQLGWAARPDGYIDYYNAGWYAYTGTTPEEMEGWGWTSVHDAEHLPDVLARWQAALAEGTPFEMEFRLRRHDGEMRWFLTRGNPIRDENGTIVRWVGINTDIQDQKLAATQLERLNERVAASQREAVRANRVKDDFLAMLGHELRNPLAPIRTALELIDLELPGDQLARERAILHRQVEHLRRMVDDLLDITRVERGKLSLTLEVVDIADVIARAVETASPLFESMEHRVTVDAPPDLTVFGDVARLVQVFSNLLINAATHTPRGGHVEVRAERLADDIFVRVRDDGEGIPEEIIERIFEAFEQRPQSIARGRGGLGLGLSIARNIVELHGGRITVESEGVGKGSTFSVQVPWHEAIAVVPEARVAEAGPPVRPRSIRVLIVDDNEDAASTLAARMVRRGFDVRVAYDGTEALQIVERFTPHMCVLDIGLPVIDGYELARRLRERPALAATTLIALTGYGQDEDRARAADAGFAHHFTKPVDFEALMTALLA